MRPALVSRILFYPQSCTLSAIPKESRDVMNNFFTHSSTNTALLKQINNFRHSALILAVGSIGLGSHLPALAADDPVVSTVATPALATTTTPVTTSPFLARPAAPAPASPPAVPAVNPPAVPVAPAIPIVNPAQAATSPVEASAQTSAQTIPLYAPEHELVVKKGKTKSSKLSTPPAPAGDVGKTLDVTDIDSKIAVIEPEAKHYPPFFSDGRVRYKTGLIVKDLVKELDQYAVDPRASYEVLLRAMKVNAFARNMDLGGESTLKSSIYVQRMIKLRPESGEANYWFGTMLAEGGGMKEGIPYLNKAIKEGYKEAHLSLANTYLLLEKKAMALTSLNNYKKVNSSDYERTDKWIDEVNNGRLNLWQK